MFAQQKGVFSSGGMEESALRLGMRWFIVSLTVFLLASVVAIIVIRLQVPNWPDLPAIPQTLWWSTGVLLMSTIAMQKLKSGWNVSWLWVSMLLVFLFLGLQILAAVQWHTELGTFQQSEEVVAIARMALYVLIFLHSMHVVGGLIPLGMIATHNWVRETSSSRPTAGGLLGFYLRYLDSVLYRDSTCQVIEIN